MVICNLFNVLKLIQNTACRTQNKRKQNRGFKRQDLFFIIIHQIPVNDRQIQKHNWDKLNTLVLPQLLSIISSTSSRHLSLAAPFSSLRLFVLVSSRPLSALLWFRARLSGKLKDKSRKWGFHHMQVEVITDFNYFSRSNESI